MDLQEEFLTLLGRDAFHEHFYPRWAAFVKVTVNGNKHLGASSNPLCLGSVSWEDLIEEIGQKRRPPVGVNGNVEAIDKAHVFSNVVRGWELEADRVAELVPLERDQHHTGPRAESQDRSVKLQGPVFMGDVRSRGLDLRPIGQELGEGL
jgi:hypothetical protein